MDEWAGCASPISADAPPPRQHVYTFGLTEDPKPVEPSAPQPPPSALTTDDVLAMHAMHPGSDFLLKKISSNPCAFDMTPPQIQKLRAAGVSDKVVLAMLQAPVATGVPAQKIPEGVDVKIPDGMAFEVELKGNVSSEELQEGTIVEMEAVEDLVVDGVPIVVRGSEARARVLAVRPAGAHGVGSGGMVHAGHHGHQRRTHSAELCGEAAGQRTHQKL